MTRDDALPEMVFILACPRSGSTLLRVMLAGHPGLFSPPELNLLPFSSMAERDTALGAVANRVMPCDQRVGLTEAVMTLRRQSAGESTAWLRDFVDRNAPIGEMFRLLREMAAPRRLVDKSTLNASCLDFLERTRVISPAAHYIHLIRHPYAVIESLERTFLRGQPQFEAARMAEELWAVPNTNTVRFLATIRTERRHDVRFEDLVGDPESTMRRICAFLGIAFDASVLNPYHGERMTAGSPGEFESLGDPNFMRHERIEAHLGEVWRSIEPRCELTRFTKDLAGSLKYDLPRRPPQPGSRRSAGGDQVILVVPPYSYRADAYILAARRLGLEPICAVDPSDGVPDGAAACVPLSFQFPECAAAAVASYACSRTAGIVAVDDGGAEIAALASRFLGLPHNPVAALAATHDKATMRMLFERAGLPSPRFRVHQLCEDPAALARLLEYPVVLKPLHLTGSRGVIRANAPHEFVAAFLRLGRLLEQPGTGPGPRRALVEDYIPGAEVSVDGILTDGRLQTLAIYDKPDPMEGPFFEETIFTTPSRHPPDAQHRIAACAEAAARAIGLRWGPVHIELRVNDGGPWLLEVAARTMGGYCSRALPFQGARTLEELVLSQATGRAIRDFVLEPGAHGVMMLPIPGEGIYRGVKGTEAAEAVPGIVGLMVTMPVGSVVTPLPEGDKYMGFLFGEGDDPAQVEKALREAHRQLAFDLDPVTRVVLRITAAV